MRYFGWDCLYELQVPMKTLFTLIFCLVCVNAWSAELLVMAVDSPTPQGPKKGDVISVFEDGQWKDGVTVPDCFVVIKVPGVAKADVQYLEEQMQDTPVDNKTPAKMVRLRKYAFPPDVIDGLQPIQPSQPIGGKGRAQSQMQVQSTEADISMLDNVEEKDLATEKQAVQEEINAEVTYN